METKERRILVVDEVAQDRQDLVEALLEEGYVPLEAEDSAQAVQRLYDEPVDLVLLAVTSPDDGGIEALEDLLAHSKLRHTPLVVASASDEAEGEARCLRLGADDYLTKPVNRAILHARIARSLERKRVCDRERARTLEIDRQKRRLERLVDAVYPLPIADALKLEGAVIPRRFEDVTVLFADVAGFTEFCENHSPDVIVEHLQEMIAVCEVIAAKYQLLKIKTIGDCFMATAGLLKTVEDPVAQSVRCGLEMIELVRSLEARWDLRVGIHCGPVVAGIVGQRQHLFDVWGDTVNAAARVESAGRPGAVHLSERAWRRVAGQFDGYSSGLAVLKGIGQTETFVVRSPKSGPAVAQESGSPCSMTETED